jgi:hypothetical protein
MNPLHAEYYASERQNDLLREAAAERLADQARRGRAAGRSTPRPSAPKGLGRLLPFLRRVAP